MSLVLSLALLVSSVVSSNAPQTSPKQYVAIIFSIGPAWQHDKDFGGQKGSADHSKNLQRLKAEGRIGVGARYADKGLVILQAANEDDARAQFTTDTMVRDSVFTMEIHKLTVFYKGCVD